MKLQAGPVAMKRTGHGWEVGRVVPRCIEGRPTEEIRDAQYTHARMDALRRLVARAGRESPEALTLLEAAGRLALAAHRQEAGMDVETTLEGVPNEERVTGAQSRRVLAWLIHCGSITKKEAGAYLNCWNLPGRIYDLRGVFGDARIESVWEENVGRGRHVRYTWRDEE